MGYFYFKNENKTSNIMTGGIQFWIYDSSRIFVVGYPYHVYFLFEKFVKVCALCLPLSCKFSQNDLPKWSIYSTSNTFGILAEP